MRPLWAATNAQTYISLRESLGTRLITAFNEAIEKFNLRIANLNPEEWDTPCYHPGGVVPARTLVGFMTLEVSVHGWDIRSKLEPEAHLHSELVPLNIEFITDYLKWFFVPGSRLAAPVCSSVQD